MVDLNGQLRLHPQFKVTAVRVGIEGLPVLVIDNFLGNPDILKEYAVTHSSFDAVSDTFYPGCRSPIPPIYCFAVRAFLGDYIAKAFGVAADRITGELGHFSIVSTPPAKLHLLQRMPHFDTTNPQQLAVLHYLCEPQQGGTSFYRHRRTGFEFIDEARKPLYANALNEDMTVFGPPPMKYVCGSDPIYERTASFSAAFNRVLIYRSINLHSADIEPDFSFDADPRTGRLTANTFFYYR